MYFTFQICWLLSIIFVVANGNRCKFRESVTCTKNNFCIEEICNCCHKGKSCPEIYQEPPSISVEDNSTTTCKITIRGVDFNFYSLRIQPTESNTGNCKEEYFEVYDGANISSQQLALYCPGEPTVVMGTKDTMFIVYTISNVSKFSGSLEIQGHEKSPCSLGDQSRNQNGACMKLFSNEVNWNKAQEKCMKLPGGATLLQVTDDIFPFGFKPRYSGIEKYIWFGATDQLMEGDWRWPDNSEANIGSMWCKNEPNNLNSEHCTEMHSNGKLNDVPCDIKRIYICLEKKKSIGGLCTINSDCKDSMICLYGVCDCPISHIFFTALNQCILDSPAAECSNLEAQAYDGVCLQKFPDPSDKLLARTLCSNLSSPSTIIQLRPNYLPPDFQPLYIDIDKPVWHGANDASREGEWRWDDDDSLANLTGMWVPGEPNNSDHGREEDCTELLTNGGLNDASCDIVRSIICMEKKRTLGGKCVQASECQDSMSCVEGVCDCTASQYYNSNTRSCMSDATIQTTCVQNETCIWNTGKCEYATNPRSFKTRICKFLLKGINESCSEEFLCSESLYCINQSCACDEEEKFEMQRQRCKTKNNFGETCESSSDCRKEFICDQGICSCKSHGVFLQSTQKCAALPSVNEGCNASLPCASNLICSRQNVCGCPDNEIFYANFEVCHPRLKFDDICSDDDECEYNMICKSLRCSCKQNEIFLLNNLACTSDSYILQRCNESNLCINFNACDEDLSNVLNERSTFSKTAFCKLGCMFTFTKQKEGLITSPNYPQDYDNNVHCLWVIVAEYSSYITLRVNDFKLENDCHNDYLEIWDGLDDNPTLLGRSCGDMNSFISVSTTNTMHILFISNDELIFKGFTATFSVKEYGSYPCNNWPLSRNINGRCLLKMDYKTDFVDAEKKCQSLPGGGMVTGIYLSSRLTEITPSHIGIEQPTWVSQVFQENHAVWWNVSLTKRVGPITPNTCLLWVKFEDYAVEELQNCRTYNAYFTCTDKKSSMGGPCKNDEECKETLICLRGYCDCKTNNILDNSFHCVPQAGE
ncbi:uncharacterized protein LOC131933030 [Physella acuta]|uniref:uncharacterized protein LOC131933030 n=1 Tax=Physella acuta TaxID=109671 RepID=UPI0027DCC816|nr:uncharacterized protein LOC131933030 [Physella acuta]